MVIICWIGLQMVIVGRVRRGEGRYGVVCNYYDFLFLLTTYYLLLLLLLLTTHTIIIIYYHHL